MLMGGRKTPAVRGAFGVYGNTQEDVEADLLRSRVEQSGAVPLTETDILVLVNGDFNGDTLVGKERVPFVSSSGLEKLVVNILLVSYVA
jgi:hypothetical protein